MTIRRIFEELHLIDYLGTALSIALGVGLDYFEVTGTGNAIMAGISAEILTIALSIRVKLSMWPKDLIKLRGQALDAENKADSNPFLFLVYKDIIKSFAADIEYVSNGKFVTTTARIPDLSVDTIKSVKVYGFATYIVNRSREFLYEQPEGIAYLNAWYEKGMEFKASGNSICRLFIVDNYESAQSKLLELMRTHVKNGIETKIIEMHQAHSLSGGSALDFGFFDDNCLMTVTDDNPNMPSRLSVYVKETSRENTGKVEKYKQFKTKLINNAISLETFEEIAHRPINKEFWDIWLPTYKEGLRPPDGVSAQDVKTMLAIAKVNLSNSTSLKVAVLGLTPEILTQCHEDESVSKVYCIDQTDYKVKHASHKIERISANWLNCSARTRVHVILGDEAVNNLAVRQYGDFFRNMSKVLEPDGVLVLRTLGRFGNPDNYEKSPTSLAGIIRESREMELNDHARRGAILAHLWAQHFRSDKDSELIDCLKYNEWLKSEGGLTTEQRKLWAFPNWDNSKHLYLSFPTQDTLQSNSSTWFNPLAMQAVDSGYAGCDRFPLNWFYKITPFQSKESLIHGS